MCVCVRVCVCSLIHTIKGCVMTKYILLCICFVIIRSLAVCIN